MGRSRVMPRQWARKIPLATRILFSRKVGPGGCWLWQRQIDCWGYARMEMIGYSTTLAHRIVYELFMGPVPEGMELDHLCRVRHCVNPGHMEPVTRTENQRRRPDRILARAKRERGDVHV